MNGPLLVRAPLSLRAKGPNLPEVPKPARPNALSMTRALGRAILNPTVPLKPKSPKAPARLVPVPPASLDAINQAPGLHLVVPTDVVRLPLKTPLTIAVLHVPHRDLSTWPSVPYPWCAITPKIKLNINTRSENMAALKSSTLEDEAADRHRKANRSPVGPTHLTNNNPHNRPRPWNPR